MGGFYNCIAVKLLCQHTV